ncbi:MAG: energy transducer TonB [Myxococcales bacterium]|nr:energy transducer TonB [Myxococcales bacterium]
MNEPPIIRDRRRGPKKAARAGTRISAAFRPVDVSGGAATYAYPGMDTVVPEDGRRALVTGSFAALLHLGLLAFLFLLASLAPHLDDVLIPVQLIKDLPETPDTPAPAPKTLAERRTPRFAPSVQSVAPQIVNPRVIADATPRVTVEAVRMNAVTAVRGPTAIDPRSISVETVRRVDPLATQRARTLDLPTAIGAAVHGPVKIDAPSGPSAGPRRVDVATPVKSMGTGTLSIGSGSSVQEGIVSNRDVLGAPTGQVLVSVDTAVGEGLLRGPGGTGTGGPSGSRAEAIDIECANRPEVARYLDAVNLRTYDRWQLPPGVPPSEVQLRFKIDVAGSATNVELVRAENNALGASAVDAMRAASPFPPMPESVRCLSGHRIRATFRNESSAS